MRIIAQVVSWLALLLGTVMPPLLFYAGRMSLERMKLAMLIGTVVWFVATPLWMGRPVAGKAAETPAGA